MADAQTSRVWLAGLILAELVKRETDCMLRDTKPNDPHAEPYDLIGWFEAGQLAERAVELTDALLKALGGEGDA